MVMLDVKRHRRYISTIGEAKKKSHENSLVLKKKKKKELWC